MADQLVTILNLNLNWGRTRAKQISQHNFQRNRINKSKTTPGSWTFGIQWVWNQKSDPCDEVPKRRLRKVSGVAALFPCLSFNVYKMSICFFYKFGKRFTIKGEECWCQTETEKEHWDRGPGGEKKNTHNWIELSERDCGDRNRPAEVDLSGSEKRHQWKREAAALDWANTKQEQQRRHSNKVREEKPLENKWRRGVTAASWSVWLRLPADGPTEGDPEKEALDAAFGHFTVATAHQNNVEAITANCVLMAPFPRFPRTNWQERHLHRHTHTQDWGIAHTHF